MHLKTLFRGMIMDFKIIYLEEVKSSQLLKVQHLNQPILFMWAIKNKMCTQWILTLMKKEKIIQVIIILDLANKMRSLISELNLSLLESPIRWWKSLIWMEWKLISLKHHMSLPHKMSIEQICSNILFGRKFNSNNKTLP